MVQEFHVLKCYSCQTFQVHQVKKSKKWICKMCGEKQSLIKEFGRGSGVDCRRHVQKLNGMQGERMMEAEHASSLLWEETTATELVTQKGGEGDVVAPQQIHTQGDPQVSRWSKYLHQPEAGRGLEAESEEENDVYLDRDRFHVNEKVSGRKRKRRGGARGDEGRHHSREEHDGHLSHDDVGLDSTATCRPETNTNSWRRSEQRAQERGTVFFSGLNHSSKRPPAHAPRIGTANSVSLPNPSRLNAATSYPDRQDHPTTAISSPPPGSNTASRWNQYLSTPHVLEEEEGDDDYDAGFWVPEGVAMQQPPGTHSAGETVGRGVSTGGLHHGSVCFSNPKTTTTTARSPRGMQGEAGSKPGAHMTTTRPACPVSVCQQQPAPEIIKAPRQRLSLPVDSLFSTGDDFDFDDGF